MLSKKDIYEFWKANLPTCGCGAPDDTCEFIYKVLCGFADGSPYDTLKKILPGVYSGSDSLEKGADNYAEWFLLYRLDQIGLLEHGGSIRGSWLTDKGKELVAAMKLCGDDLIPIITDNIGIMQESGEVKADPCNECRTIKYWDKPL